MLFVLMLASDLHAVSSLSSHDLLEPGPELGAGEADLLPGQLVEHDSDAVLQFGQGVACRPVGVPFNCAQQVKFAGITVMGVRGPEVHCVPRVKIDQF